jgi:hypothetical protein
MVFTVSDQSQALTCVPAHAIHRATNIINTNRCTQRMLMSLLDCTYFSHAHVLDVRIMSLMICVPYTGILTPLRLRCCTMQSRPHRHRHTVITQCEGTHRDISALSSHSVREATET